MGRQKHSVHESTVDEVKDPDGDFITGCHTFISFAVTILFSLIYENFGI